MNPGHRVSTALRNNTALDNEGGQAGRADALGCKPSAEVTEVMRSAPIFQ
jgi:hypothetical protein